MLIISILLVIFFIFFWINYLRLQGRNGLIINSFKATGITDAAEKANEVFRRIENPIIIYRS